MNLCIVESYPGRGRGALVDMINGGNMKTAAVGFRSSDAKPSPRQSIPPPATEEVLASPPCPPVPQVFGLDSVPDETARNRRGSAPPRAWEAGGLPLD